MTSFSPHAIILLLLALLSGCASTSRAPYVPAKLEGTQRQQAFEKVLETIDKDYVDPRHNGVDWRAVAERYRARVLAAPDDPSFWRELNLMVGEMKDAHTTVRSPLEVNAKPTQRGNHGLTLARIDGALVIKAVTANSQAHLLGVRAGHRLIRIENEPAEAWWQRMAAEVRGSSTERSNFALVSRELNVRPVDSLLTLGLQRGDGSEYALTLRQDPQQVPGLRSHLLASQLGYLRLSAFNPAVQTDLEASLNRMTTAKGLVLDLRENGGGSHLLTMDLLARFLAPGTVGEVLTRDNKRHSALAGLLDITPSLEIKFKPEVRRLSAPLAVLIDERSASAAELTAAVLQDQGRARVFGVTSCGCLLVVRANGEDLPGGGKLIFSEIEMRVGKARKRIEGTGVQPDEVINPATAALLAGQDQVLEAAQAWLLKQAKLESRP